MKKTLFLFGASALIASSTLITSCSTEEAPEPKLNYGVVKQRNDTPKEAYYALFGAIIIIVVLIIWGLKKMSNKKY